MEDALDALASYTTYAPLCSPMYYGPIRSSTGNGVLMVLMVLPLRTSTPPTCISCVYQYLISMLLLISSVHTRYPLVHSMVLQGLSVCSDMCYLLHSLVASS